jgi:NADH:ubiquinone oxidoreductase subunit H
MTYRAADPTWTVPSYAPPPLPAPTWTPADLGVQLGLSAPHAQFVAATVEAFLVGLLASLAIARIARRESFAEFVRDAIRASARPGFDRLPRLGALVAPIVAILTIPFGPGWECAFEIDGGLVLAIVLTTVTATWIASANATGDEPDHDMGVRQVSRVVVVELASALAIAGPILFANGSSLVAIVDGQRALGLPYGIVQPVGLVAFFASCLLANDLLRSAKDDPVRQASVAGLLLAKVCIGTTAFLGGWWFPGFERLARAAAGALGGHGNVSWQYAVACAFLGSLMLVVKIIGVLAVVGWARTRLASAHHDSIVHSVRRSAAPLALANAIALGAVFIIGLPTGQGGFWGFFEVTRAGIVVGSRFFGYGYLLAAALVSILVVATGTLVLSGRKDVTPENRS